MKYTDWIYLAGVLAMVGIAGVYLYYWRKAPQNSKPKTHNSPTTQNPKLTTLSIQAYERMVVFTERCGFNSLIDRLPAGNLNARQLGEVFLEAIRTEFEHNLSQQIYISDASWQSICDMKDQQSFIIRELLNTLPENASGIMLIAALKSFMEADEKASIQPLVLEILRREARKQLQQT